MKFLLYGSYGYTGQLIARFAQDFGLSPILAGRSLKKLEQQAKATGYPFRVFDLNDQPALHAALKEVPLVLHAAGPFAHTAQPMMEACLATGTHYLDITGEIAVFEMAASLDERAQKAKIMLMPGTGFDVVPTDCMAVYLKNKLPTATHLQLAFAMQGGRTSHGTATTMAENLGAAGAIREAGQIIPVPVGHRAMTVPFYGKPRFVMSIPWGDVSTAFYSTGIPNIETFTGISPKLYKWMKWQGTINWLLQTNLVRNIVKRQINKQPAGPTDKERAAAQSLVWGKTWDVEGREVEARLRCPEGYTLTAFSSLLIAQKALQGNAPIGFQTPAKAYGADLVMEIEGVEREEV
ncbi:MAG: saccharopine dehydrogenase NADP-binding domain-containing protein [Saprospiraceae bacterium]